MVQLHAAWTYTFELLSHFVITSKGLISHQAQETVLVRGFCCNTADTQISGCYPILVCCLFQDSLSVAEKEQ